MSLWLSIGFIILSIIIGVIGFAIACLCADVLAILIVRALKAFAPNIDKKAEDETNNKGDERRYKNDRPRQCEKNASKRCCANTDKHFQGYIPAISSYYRSPIHTLLYYRRVKKLCQPKTNLT